MREALRSARRLLSAPVFEGSVFESLYPPSNLTTDDELNSFVRSALGPYLHGVGSAGMSPRGAKWGVVDPDHRVKGTNGLRVIDVSVLVSTFVYGYSIGFIYVAQAEYSKRTYSSTRLCPCRAGECDNQKSMAIRYLETTKDQVEVKYCWANYFCSQGRMLSFLASDRYQYDMIDTEKNHI